MPRYRVDLATTKHRIYTICCESEDEARAKAITNHVDALLLDEYEAIGKIWAVDVIELPDEEESE